MLQHAILVFGITILPVLQGNSCIVIKLLSIALKFIHYQIAPIVGVFSQLIAVTKFGLFYRY